MGLLLLLPFIAVFFLFYTYITFKIRYRFWEKLNVPHTKPTFPFGHIQGWLKLKHFAFVSQDMYKSLKHFGHYAGLYFINAPILFVLTPEFAKTILVKDFAYFTDRGLYSNKKIDPPSANLFFLDGADWRRTRQKFTSAFTSGKIKAMYGTIQLVGDEFIKQTHRRIESDGSVIDVKDFMACFTTDIIGSCGFGIECNTILNPNSTFRIMGKKMFSSSKMRNFKNMFCMLYKREAKFFKAKFSEGGVTEFLGNFVERSMKYREENNVCRNDFMQQMIDMWKNELKDGDISESDRFSFEDIIGQLFVFFFAGFETSAATISYCLYELAMNQDVQQTLRKNVEESFEKNGNKFTYESINEMTYLDEVLSETLRKYPPIATLHRCVSKNYTLPNGSVVPKGTFVVISTYAFHHDPELYPNPEVFDPERFNEINKANRKPCSYLPFGEGSRNCVGMRFGLIVTKLGIAMLIKNFKFSVSYQTNVPLEIDPVCLTFVPKNKLFLRVDKI